MRLSENSEGRTAAAPRPDHFPEGNGGNEENEHRFEDTPNLLQRQSPQRGCRSALRDAPEKDTGIAVRNIARQHRRKSRLHTARLPAGAIAFRKGVTSPNPFRRVSPHFRMTLCKLPSLSWVCPFPQLLRPCPIWLHRGVLSSTCLRNFEAVSASICCQFFFCDTRGRLLPPRHGEFCPDGKEAD